MDTGELDRWKKCLLIFLGVGILLMVIILPISFVGVEYYQVCFHMYKSCIMITRTLKNGELKRNYVRVNVSKQVRFYGCLSCR